LVKKCANCDNHLATVKFIDPDSAAFLAYIHDDYLEYCECCSLKKALAYCKDCAKRIPELERALKRVKCE
jgi:hypothetical protein